MTLIRDVSTRFTHAILGLTFLLGFPLLVLAELNNGNRLDDEVKIFSLEQAIQTALANSSELKFALFDLKSADQQVIASWGEVMPNLDADMAYQRNMKVPVNFLPAIIFDQNADPDALIPVRFGTDNNWSGGLTLSQNLFKGEALVGIATSELYQQAQKENYRATAQQIVTQTRLAYHAVLIARERISLQKATINRLKENLRDNEARVKAGLIDDYDVLRIRIQLKNEEPNVIEAENNLDETLRNLKITMGIPVFLNIDVEGDLKSYDIANKTLINTENENLKDIERTTDIDFLEEETLTELLPDYRGDLRALKYRSDLQDKRIFADYSGYLPILTASYSMRWTAAQPGSPDFFGTSDQRARSEVLGIAMTWNLFNGLKTTTQLQQSKIEKKRIEEQRELQLRTAINQTLTAQDNVRRLLLLAPSMKEAVKLARTGYERAKSRYESGVGSQLEVTDAELQLRTAELNYSTMVFSYLNAKANYDLAVGKVPFIDNDLK